MQRTVIYGQDPPLDLDFVIYRGGFWRADLAWQNADGSPVLAVDKQMTLRCEKSIYGGVIYPPDLDSTLEAVPAVNTADYLQLSDGSVEIGLKSDTTAQFTFHSTVYRIFLITAGVPELWAKGRIRLVN